MAVNTVNKPKKTRRRMKKQVRRTIAALFMASAIAVAAIPVEPIHADTPDPGPETSAETIVKKAPVWVETLNFTTVAGVDPASYESAPGKSTVSPSKWHSSVPLIDAGETIYTTSTANANETQYRFAFVPKEPGSSTKVAVIVGAEINGNTLIFDEKVDAYKKYSANTSATNFCAVSMNDQFLYYPSPTQRVVSLKPYYTVVGKVQPSLVDPVYNDIPFDYTYSESSGTIPTDADIPAALDSKWTYTGIYEEAIDNEDDTYTFHKEITTYIPEEYVVSEWVTNPETGVDELKDVTKLRWKMNVDVSDSDMKPSMIPGFEPCYDTQKANWEGYGDSGLYYYKNDSTGLPTDLSKIEDFVNVGSTEARYRIHDVEVWYIGYQNVIVDPVTKDWKINTTVDYSTNPEAGIFAGNTQVTTVQFPSTLRGIGDCAFYSSAVNEVVFDDSGNIDTIGNAAFADCRSLRTVQIPVDSSINVIGRAAFAGDRALPNITIPASISAIGDYCFWGCTSLGDVDLTSGGRTANYLDAIGYHAFEGCTSLSYVEFPQGFYQDSSGLPDGVVNKIPITTFKGCSGIQYIRMNNSADDDANLDIVDGLDPTGAEPGDDSPDHKWNEESGTGCDITSFIHNLRDPDGFYFEGSTSDSSAIYKTAKVHSATFKHLGEPIYEKFVICDEKAPNSHLNTFMVDGSDPSRGKVTGVKVVGGCKELTIPSVVGKINVTDLTSTSFNNASCTLEKVHIPITVQNIETDAFRGCHKLSAVIFEPDKAGNYNYGLHIDTEAFDSQLTDCSHTLDTTPVLSFTAPISDSQGILFPAFEYAMNPNNKINYGAQPRTYITYYTDFPTMLEVQLKRDALDTGGSEPFARYATLVDYPTWDELKTISASDLAKYPYLSDADIAAITGAIAAYYDDDIIITDAQQQIIDAALNPSIPYGVVAIEDGLFSGVKADGTPVSGAGPDTNMVSIDLNSITTIDPYTFKGCEKLNKVDIDGTSNIGDYAFWNDTALKTVIIDGDDMATTNDDGTTGFGMRPFRGCSDLVTVDFVGSNPKYTCGDAIIYQTDGTNRNRVIECLETRGQYMLTGGFNGDQAVNSDELSGISSISKEAFMNCDSINSVDLSSSRIEQVPLRCFAADDKLGTVKLPESVSGIAIDAFLDTIGLAQVDIPSLMTFPEDQYVFALTQNGYAPSAMYPEDEYQGYMDETKNPYMDPAVIARTRTLIFSTPEASFATKYANADTHPYINATKAALKYDVYFWDEEADDPSVPYDLQSVDDGKPAKTPQPNPHERDASFPKKFVGWKLGVNVVNVDETPITAVTNYYAKYEGSEYTVIFYDEDGKTPLKTQTVTPGGDATPPEVTPPAGYTFKRWTPEDGYKNVTKDCFVTAIYEKVDTANKHEVIFYNFDNSVWAQSFVDDGQPAPTPPTPTWPGYKFNGWSDDFSNVTEKMKIHSLWVADPSGGGSGGNGGSSSGNNGGNSNNKGNGSTGNSGNSKNKYTVTVVNGSGSGTYEEGATVVVAANDPATGKTFSKWVTADVNLASTALSATTFTMPGKNVTVTAQYTDAAKSQTVQYATGNSARPQATGSTAKGQTSVLVSKGGLSNIDLASATVRGSTDSFVVKVTESNEATTQVANALNNRYGSLDGIKYWACDISLYDSTGNTKITDTSGLTVDITLPIPTELQAYGGNNKAGAVANNQLEDLSTKFNTVNGTPTVTFTATHFSPYVIYADTNNLNAAEMLDVSPKTGDPIHPKWFLAIGLAAASIVLFLKKDKRPARVVTA